MASNADFFLNKTLGKDFMESLNKFELWKPGTRSTVDHEEIRTALQIVPRTILSLLIKELSPMTIGETKEVQLMLPGNAMMRVTKHERDVFSGDIEQENKKVVDFKFRSLPGIGLVIMSAFELYDQANLINTPAVEPEAASKIHKLIDERMALYDLVGKVVDKKLMEKEAIEKLLMMKLTEALAVKDKKLDKVAEIAKIQEETTPNPNEYHRGMTNGLKVAESIVTDQEPKFLEPKKPKGSKQLKEFFEKREKKLKKNEYNIQMMKGEQVNCPDCGKNIFDGQVFAGCICLGDNMESKLFIKKTEDGVRVRFGKGWDSENIEMLLEVLRRKRG